MKNRLRQLSDNWTFELKYTGSYATVSYTHLTLPTTSRV